jgi:TonB family protein
MNYFEELKMGRYGSFELKRLVGPNLLWGLLISMLIHAVLVSSPFIVTLFHHEEAIPPPLRVVDISQLTKLKSQQDTPEQVRIALPKLAAPPKAAIPIAVREEEVEAIPAMMPTQMELSAALSASGGSDASLDIKPGEQIIITGEDDPDAVPDPGKYIPFEVPPQPLADFSPPPAYPKNMSDIGIKCVVKVQAYVDKKGEVREIRIVSAKPPNLGFEEEVKKVITKWKFTPAIQNHQPIGVWVEIPFNFNIEN